jgi:hypothetical protein
VLHIAGVLQTIASCHNSELGLRLIPVDHRSVADRASFTVPVANVEYGMAFWAYRIHIDGILLAPARAPWSVMKGA